MIAVVKRYDTLLLGGPRVDVVRFALLNEVALFGGRSQLNGDGDVPLDADVGDAEEECFHEFIVWMVVTARAAKCNPCRDGGEILGEVTDVSLFMLLLVGDAQRGVVRLSP